MNSIDLLRTYGAGGVVFLVVVWLAKVWIERSITSTIDGLQTREIEKLKTYNARLLNNFGIYNQNRHESYAKLHELLLVAQGKLVQRASNYVERFTYNECGAEDIRSLLSDLRIPSKEAERICSLWDSDRDAAKNEVYRWQDIVAGNEMEKAVAEFHNEYLRRELYLSEPVAQKLRSMDEAILAARIYGRRDQPQEVAHAKRERREQLDGIMTKLETLSEELRTLMQAEMRVGQAD